MEFDPGPTLRPFVRCLWSLEGQALAGDGARENVLPDGCPELILNRAERFMRHGVGGERLQARILVVGQIKQRIVISGTGVIELIGIRFEPAGMHALLGIPMHELTDQDTSLSEVHRALYARLARTLAFHPKSSCIPQIQALLLDQLRARRRLGAGQSGLLPTLLSALGRRGASSERVARQQGLSRRSLERAMRLEVGLSPRHFLRIQRLQSVLGQLEVVPERVPWAELALQHGYWDQAHMIRDFRQLAGTTPGRFLAERTSLGACFDSLGLSRCSNP